MIKLKIKELNILVIKVLFSCLIITTMLFLSFAKMTFSSSLKKGIYEIKNHKMGGNMYVDEKGKIILKSEPKCTISKIEDLFTKETVLLCKHYDKLYESSDYVVDSEYGYDRVYEGLENAYTEYYTITGNRLDFTKGVIGVVDYNVFFSDGTAKNLTLNVDFKLEGVQLDSDKKSYYMIKKFGEYMLLNVVGESKIYIYDRRLKLVKSIEGYFYSESMNNIKDILVLSKNHVDVNDKNSPKNLGQSSYNALDKDLNFVFEKDVKSIRRIIDNVNLLGVEFAVDENDNIVDYNPYNYVNHIEKKFDLVSRKMIDNDDGDNYYNVRYVYDKEKLTTTIIDGNKKIALNDVNMDTCIGFSMDNKKYYYVHTTNKKNYIYNDNGDRIKMLYDYDTGAVKFLCLDQNYLLAYSLGERIDVFNKNFEVVKEINIPKEKWGKNVLVEKIMNDKYYFITIDGINGNQKYRMVYDLNLDELDGFYGKTVKIINDKYLFKIGVIGPYVYDDNYRKIYQFKGDIIDNVYTLRVKDKEYICVKILKHTYIFDNSFKFIIELDDNSKIHGLLPELGTGNAGLKLPDDLSNIVIERIEDGYGGTIDVYDLNFNKLESFTIGPERYEVVDQNYDQTYDPYSDTINSDYEPWHIGFTKNGMIYFCNGWEKYDLYKIGKGYILKDFYYIGEFEDDHFTYCNGFYYGFMDYDLNILCQYSIFDKFDEDINYGYWW